MVEAIPHLYILWIKKKKYQKLLFCILLCDRMTWLLFKLVFLKNSRKSKMIDFNQYILQC